MKINSQLVLFIVCGFFAFFLFFEAILLAWKDKHGPEAKKLAQRLKNISNDSLYSREISILRARIQDSHSPLIKLINLVSDARKLDMLLMQSGKLWGIEQFSQYIALTFAAGFVLSLLFGLSWLLALVVGGFTSLIPFIYIFSERQKRLEKIEQQLPDAIDSMARSLRAGHAFQSAFKIVSEEFPEPIATEFRISIEETNLGISLQESMLNLSKRVPITDLKFFVIAILIQRESGGNLANILTSMSTIIRDRFTLFREIKTLSAEGRMSGLVMWLMPILIIPVMSVISPFYASVLFGTDTGLLLLKIGAVLMILAGLWMRKIVQIKV